jgi:SAM-dependent methyltransferase
MNCRHCREAISLELIDLGEMPPSNSYLNSVEDFQNEHSYPLVVMVCENCWLVQTKDFANRKEFFSDTYAYFSSTSKTWLEHSEIFASWAIQNLPLGASSFVVEVASNDGYLLKNFKKAGIPNLGIEPTASTALEAKKLDLEIIEDFFGLNLAEKLVASHRKADLIVGNNVYAHVPDINDFTQGLKAMLAPEGTISLEFPHLLNLLAKKQFDTIYHEHYSYLSLIVVERIFKAEGLRVYDVQKIETHGGSLRILACHEFSKIETKSSVDLVLDEERNYGLDRQETYQGFAHGVIKIRNDFRAFLKDSKTNSKVVVAYGAAAKGNTLLNYCAITVDEISDVFDAASSKQGKYLPGTHIPISKPEDMKDKHPDYVVILPWNLREEVIDVVAETIGAERVKFVTAIPELEIFE